jgi:hypothetical protein
MKIQEILAELRTNPTQNTKVSVVDQLEQIAKQYGTDDIFVRFSSTDKFGVNPRHEYKTTPLGIYAYPLDYVLDTELSNVPYMSTAPYIWVFKNTAPPNTVIDSERPVDPTIVSRIEQLFGDMYKKKGNDYALDSFDDDSLDRGGDDGYEWAGYDYDTDEPFIDKTSPLRIFHMVNMYYNDMEEDDWSEAEQVTLSPSEKTKLFRAAGVTALVDHGHGLIHINEGTQAVFFDISKLKMIKLIQQGSWNKPAVDKNKSKEYDVDNGTPSFAAHDTAAAERGFNRAKRAEREVPEFERDILQSPLMSYRYATEILKRPWPEAEEIIRSKPDLWKKYKTAFDIEDD